jgi:hypothetical protein
MATLDYQVTNTDNTLWLEGSIRTGDFCCDIPYAFAHYAVQAVRLPDLFTMLLPSINFGVSTNQVFPGDVVDVHWKGYNNSTVCIPEFPPCVERFGPAFGPWQDAVFLFSSATNFLLGTSGFSGSLATGSAYTNQGSFLIPPDTAPGLYGIEIRIDYQAGNTNGVVAEQNEGNNTARIVNLLNVRPPLAITGVKRPDDRTAWLELSGSVTQQVRIQVSQTLSSNTWTDLTNFPAFRGAVECWDDTGTNQTRFYRALSP